MFAVLRRRDFSLLWFSGLVSVAGDWVLLTALPYFVYARTGSTLATAGMTAAELAPSIVLSSLAGVFVDLWNRKHVLVIANLLQAVTVAALFLVSDDGSLWLVYAVAVAQSAISSFSMPAEQALLPSLVPRDLLVEANAMNALNNRLGRLAGVPLGAALLAWIGLDAVVLVDAVSFLAAALLVAPIVVPPAAEQSPPTEADGLAGATAAAESALATFWREWLEGIRLVRDDRTIAVLFVVFGLMTFGGTMLDPLAVPWVRDVLEAGVGIYAVLTMTHAIAGIGGSLLVGTLGTRFTPRQLIGWPSIVAGVVLLVRFNLPVLWVAIALTAVGGATSVASSVGVDTLAQERVPERLRGRVFGSLQGTIWLLSLLGAVVGGVLGELVGIRPALDLAAFLVAVAGVVVLLAIPRSGDDAAVIQIDAERH
jgi:MFS family permease